MGVVWIFDTGVSMFSTHYGTLNILISLFQHPVVKVVESDNEMVISDYYTDEFIAKKIFYNDHQQSGKSEEMDDKKKHQEQKDHVQEETVQQETKEQAADQQTSEVANGDNQESKNSKDAEVQDGNIGPKASGKQDTPAHL